MFSMQVIIFSALIKQVFKRNSFSVFNVCVHISGISLVDENTPEDDDCSHLKLVDGVQVHKYEDFEFLFTH